MTQYDCIIAGSGPAGLAVAFELITARPDIKILLIEKEKVSSGGLRNDCKMNFTWPIGFPSEYWTQKDSSAYLKRVEAFLTPEIMPQKNLTTYQKRASRIGVELLMIRQSHLGTDGGLALIKNLLARLVAAGIEISGRRTYFDRQQNKNCSYIPQRSNL